MKHAISLLSLATVLGTKALAINPDLESRLKLGASGLTRTNKFIQLEYPLYQDNNLLDVLNAYGIIADEKSQVFVHDEQGKIDLSCFNCLINNRNSSDSIPSPENEIVRAK